MRLIKAAVIAAAVACLLLPLSPSFIERWYSTGLYPFVQRALTTLSNLVPFALFDLLTVGTVVIVIVVIVRAIREARRLRQWSPLMSASVNVLTGAALVYLVFLVFWGFNYRRVSMSSRLIVDRAAPTEDTVAALGLQAIQQINALYARAHATIIDAPWRDESLRAAFDAVQGELADAPRAVPGRLKQTIYGPYFRWTSVDGMVDPFALEVLGNPDLIAIERPFVVAHEWAHLAGYADESEANFVGWLTCLRANEAAQYSGWMFLYWQLANEVSGPTRARLAAALEAGPRRDIDAIVERLQRGQLPLLRRSSWAVYDKYLKANRVEAGVRSYGLVVTLILRARFDEGWKPVRRSQ
jgi:hypothetical protein